MRVLVEEDAAGEKLPRVADLDAPVLVLVHAASLACEEERLGAGLDQVGDPLVVEGQVLRELALLLPGEDPLEVLVVADRAVGVVGPWPGGCSRRGSRC
jgi:hypothetical protein